LSLSTPSSCPASRALWGSPLWSLARHPEEDVLVADTSVRARMTPVGFREGGADRRLPAVRYGQLVRSRAASRAPRRLGAGIDEGTGALARPPPGPPGVSRDRR